MQVFFIGSWSCLWPSTFRRLFMLYSGYRPNGTPQRYTFKQKRQFCQNYPPSSYLHRLLPKSLRSKYRNINLFPFHAWRLRMHLGSTNSRLTTYCRETLGHSADPILTDLCCYYCQDFHWRTIQRISQSSFISNPTPSYQITPYSGRVPWYRW